MPISGITALAIVITALVFVLRLRSRRIGSWLISGSADHWRGLVYIGATSCVPIVSATGDAFTKSLPKWSGDSEDFRIWLITWVGAVLLKHPELIDVILKAVPSLESCKTIVGMMSLTFTSSSSEEDSDEFEEDEVVEDDFEPLSPITLVSDDSDDGGDTAASRARRVHRAARRTSNVEKQELFREQNDERAARAARRDADRLATEVAREREHRKRDVKKAKRRLMAWGVRDTFLLSASADAYESPMLTSERREIDRSFGMEMVGKKVLESANLQMGDVTVFDVYSCFPAAVQVQHPCE